MSGFSLRGFLVKAGMDRVQSIALTKGHGGVG